DHGEAITSPLSSPCISRKRSCRKPETRVTKRRQRSTGRERRGGYLFDRIPGQSRNCKVDRNRRRAIAAAARGVARPSRRETGECHGSLRKPIGPVAHVPV